MSEQTTLLIVDDELEIRENLCDYLEYKGFVIVQAANGLEALDVMQHQRLDLVLSDFKMPGMNGLEMLIELGRRENEVPVVIMTAFGTMEYAIEAMKNGAVDFITKPIELEYLCKVIDRSIQRSKLEQKIKEQQRQLDDDLQHAKKIQQCMLPDPVDTSHLAVHYRYHPLIAIGGDYLTFHQYSESRIAVALYDVSGHGVSAALTSSMIHSRLQQRFTEDWPLEDTAKDLNRFITHNIGKTGTFATMVMLIADTGKHNLQVINAGHPELYIRRNGVEALESIPSLVPPVGMTPHLLRDETIVSMNVGSGDRVMVYTDGFIEALNQEGKAIGQSGLRTLLEQHSGLPPHQFLEKIFKELNSYRFGEPDDDLTLLTIDFK